MLSVRQQIHQSHFATAAHVKRNAHLTLNVLQKILQNHTVSVVHVYNVLLITNVVQDNSAIIMHVEAVSLIPNVQQQIHKHHIATPVYVTLLNAPVLLFRDVLQVKYAIMEHVVHVLLPLNVLQVKDALMGYVERVLANVLAIPVLDNVLIVRLVHTVSMVYVDHVLPTLNAMSSLYALTVNVLTWLVHVPLALNVIRVHIAN